MPEHRVVLVTGASTGIGHSISQCLSGEGFCTFGTSRNPQAYPPPLGWRLIQLDVCSDESARRCIQEVLAQEGRLDVLINNAGYGLNGALEEATLEQVLAQFETNYFGALRMIKNVLPLMRAQASGNIINITSGSASLRLPFYGHYTAAKCALEGYSEVLRWEVKPFGIHVSVIEPGYFKSNIAETIQLGSDLIPDYEPGRSDWLTSIRKGIRKGPDPKPVAQSVLHILHSRKPRFLYIAGLDLAAGRWARRLLPEGLYRALLSRFLGVPAGT